MISLELDENNVFIDNLSLKSKLQEEKQNQTIIEVISENTNDIDFIHGLYNKNLSIKVDNGYIKLLHFKIKRYNSFTVFFKRNQFNWYNRILSLKMNSNDKIFLDAWFDNKINSPCNLNIDVYNVDGARIKTIQLPDIIEINEWTLLTINISNLEIEVIYRRTTLDKEPTKVVYNLTNEIIFNNGWYNNWVKGFIGKSPFDWDTQFLHASISFIFYTQYIINESEFKLIYNSYLDKCDDSTKSIEDVIVDYDGCSYEVEEQYKENITINCIGKVNHALNDVSSNVGIGYNPVRTKISPSGKLLFICFLNGVVIIYIKNESGKWILQNNILYSLPDLNVQGSKGLVGMFLSENFDEKSTNPEQKKLYL